MKIVDKWQKRGSFFFKYSELLCIRYFESCIFYLSTSSVALRFPILNYVLVMENPGSSFELDQNCRYASFFFRHVLATMQLTKLLRTKVVPLHLYKWQNFQSFVLFICNTTQIICNKIRTPCYPNILPIATQHPTDLVPTTSSFSASTISNWKNWKTEWAYNDE